MTKAKKFDTRKLVLLALLTAIVVVLQLIGSFIRIGPASVSLVLVPIVVGAALISIAAGAWLGFVFGFVVLVTEGLFFMGLNPIGTIITIIVRGILAGLSAGVLYYFISKKSNLFAAIGAAIICPIVNTGIFLLGVAAFFPTFFPVLSPAAIVNFPLELIINLVLAPTIVRLVQHGQKRG